MLASDFDYFLPPDLIAQQPSTLRDQSRLLVLNRNQHQLHHDSFKNVTKSFRTGDVLVLNDSKVIRARLRGAKDRTGGKIEMLLVEEISANDWWVMLKPAKRLHTGDEIILHDTNGAPTSIRATLSEKNTEGHCRLVFNGMKNIRDVLDELGETPLPPYIVREEPARSAEDFSRYQTIYARDPGSVAAPTAGLHFTKELLAELRALGVEIHFVTLHVGLGTFAPVKAENISDHVLHNETFFVSEDAARAINAAKSEGRRVFAVGTTSVRVLESLARIHSGRLIAGAGKTDIFIHPPFTFQIVDALITNFHLPRSTLLMLVSAFTGREIILRAYHEAIEQRYRFYSYGDAMLIV